MKSAQEYVLKETGQACKFGYSLDVIPMVDAIRIMKEYAKQVAQQALRDAAENICSEDNFHHPTELLKSITNTIIKTP